MNELVKVDHKEFGLEESRASQIAAQFKPMLDKMIELEKEYNNIIKLDINDPETSVKAKAVRLKYVKVRTGTAEIHKKQKAFYRSGGLYVDGWRNAQIFASQGNESELMNIEKHAENLEKEKLYILNSERRELCMPFIDDESLLLPDLGCMSTQLWDNYILGLEASHKARVVAEKKAEDERIAVEKAEIERQKAIEAENLKLKKEAEEAAKKQEADRLKRERLAKEAKEKNDLLNNAAKCRQEMLFNIGITLDFESCKSMSEDVWVEFYEEKNNAYQSEQNKIHLEQLKTKKIEADRKAKEEKLQKERDDLTRKLKAQKEKDKKAIEEAEALRQSELNKGDAAKINDLIADLNKLKIKYSFKSAKNIKLYSQTGELLDKVIGHISR